MSWRTRFRRALASTDELQAGEEIVEATLHGGELAQDVQIGEKVTLSGVLRSVTYAASAARPQLIAELYDGSGSVDLIWLGRRDIRGVEPGRRLVVTGRVTSGTRRHRLVMYNPAYTLLPRPAA